MRHWRHASDLLYCDDNTDDAVAPGLSRIEQAKYELQMAIGELREIEKAETRSARKARRVEALADHASYLCGLNKRDGKPFARRARTVAVRAYALAHDIQNARERVKVETSL